MDKRSKKDPLNTYFLKIKRIINHLLSDFCNNHKITSIKWLKLHPNIRQFLMVIICAKL